MRQRPTTLASVAESAGDGREDSGMNELGPREQVRTLAGDVLAHWLAAEDQAEDAGRLHPDDRLTCHVHGRWIHQCVRWSVSIATILTLPAMF